MIAYFDICPFETWQKHQRRNAYIMLVNKTYFTAEVKKCLFNLINCLNCAVCNVRTQFQCDNGWCVSRCYRCNGYPLCPDRSDERDCRKFVKISLLRLLAKFPPYERVYSVTQQLVGEMGATWEPSQSTKSPRTWTRRLGSATVRHKRRQRGVTDMTDRQTNFPRMITRQSASRFVYFCRMYVW